MLVLAACVASPSAVASCVTVHAADGALLGAYPVGPLDTSVALSYVHSVTRTPVHERYRLDGTTFVQTELRFQDHGPGLPAQPAAGESFAQEGDAFVLRMARPVDGIRARVDAAQSPRLAVGGTDVDLAQWGSRAIRLAALPGPCSQR
jgi:hypothetical protein